MTQKGFAPILIVFILAVVTSVGGFLVYQNSKTKPSPIPPPQQTQSTPTPLLSETSVKEGAETANWKTYTSTQWKFSFKYPLDATVSLDTNINPSDGVQVWLESLPGGHTIYITAIKNKDNLSLNNSKELFEDGPFTTSLEDAEVKEIKLGGYKAFRADNCCLDREFNFWAETEIITIKDGVIFELRAEAEPSTEKNKKVNNKDKDILEAIFSTFKFLP